MSNNKAATIYGNTFYTLNNRGAAFNFSFEIWDTWGGLEIRDNVFTGGGTIDLGGHYTYKGAYSFGASIHNNIMALPALEAYNVSEVIAITVESWNTIQDVLIYNNRITNFGTGVQVTFGVNPGGTAANLWLYNNIFENIGYSDTTGGSSAIGFVYQTAVATWNNINIINNVMKAGGSNSNIGIRFSVTGATTNFNIKNNIISGFAVRAIGFGNDGGSINGLAITNNIFYNNGSTINLGGVTPSGYTNSSNLTTSPSFVSGSDFHLASTSSPAYHAGVAVSGISADYSGLSYYSSPSIGAYEFNGTAPAIPVTSVTVTGTGGATTIVTAGGTLQMIAAILPVNATIQTVAWSVVNGTGTATISPTGLLTAITNGTVTVKATSNG
jgi:hypothetical protein